MKLTGHLLALEAEAHGGFAHFEAFSQRTNHFVVLSIDCTSIQLCGQEKFRHQQFCCKRIRLDFCRICAGGGKCISSQRTFINVNGRFDLGAMELNVSQLMREGEPLPIGVMKRVYADDRNPILYEGHSR